MGDLEPMRPPKPPYALKTYFLKILKILLKIGYFQKVGFLGVRGGVCDF